MLDPEGFRVYCFPINCLNSPVALFPRWVMANIETG